MFGDPILPERVWRKITINPSTGCWEWLGYRMKNGYGVLGYGGSRLVHRVLYETFVSPLISGMDVDHLCRVRHCCNPDHLDQVSRIENVMRGLKGSLHTHCYKGHEMTESNVYRQGPGKAHRVCKTCAQRRGKEYRVRVATRCA